MDLEIFGAPVPVAITVALINLMFGWFLLLGGIKAMQSAHGRGMGRFLFGLACMGIGMFLFYQIVPLLMK